MGLRLALRSGLVYVVDSVDQVVTLTLTLALTLTLTLCSSHSPDADPLPAPSVTLPYTQHPLMSPGCDKAPNPNPMDEVVTLHCLVDAGADLEAPA